MESTMSEKTDEFIVAGQDGGSQSTGLMTQRADPVAEEE
jgi:hypothetical protein